MGEATYKYINIAKGSRTKHFVNRSGASAIHHPKLKLLWPPGVFLPEEVSPTVLLGGLSPKERLLPPPGGLRTPPIALRGCSFVDDPNTMLPDISFFFSSETCMKEPVSSLLVRMCAYFYLSLHQHMHTCRCGTKYVQSRYVYS